ncbi:MAG: alpha/beta hydrolase [Candidatus Eremiobacteraeota bacterium]|nr:alpha/beta hydrolase [Candidatus Eremiobacteraeota bacterium]
MLRDQPRRLQVRGGGGARLNVVETGPAAAPPILFIHGYCRSSVVWRKQFESDLADEFRLVAFDLRGHGESEKPDDPQAYAASQLWADDVAAVIDALDLRKPVVVAWSYGGLVICDYLRARSDETLGAIDFVAAPTSQGGEKARKFNDPRFVALFPALFATDDATLEPALARLDELCTIPGVPTSAVARQWMIRGRKNDNDDVLAALRIPVLCTHGSDDAVVTLEASEHVARVVPGARLSIYPGSGHAPFFDDAPRFNRELRGLAGGAQVVYSEP